MGTEFGHWLKNGCATKNYRTGKSVGGGKITANRRRRISDETPIELRTLAPINDFLKSIRDTLRRNRE